MLYHVIPIQAVAAACIFILNVQVDAKLTGDTACTDAAHGMLSLDLLDIPQQSTQYEVPW